MARQILITGGTSGIGAGIAAAFAAAGDQVTVTGATAAEVAAAAGRAGTTPQVLDVRDGAAVQALVAALGPLDVVVNCAGVIRRGAEHDPVAFADTVDINLNGTMRVCAAARPALAPGALPQFALPHPVMAREQERALRLSRRLTAWDVDGDADRRRMRGAALSAHRAARCGSTMWHMIMWRAIDEWAALAWDGYRWCYCLTLVG